MGGKLLAALSCALFVSASAFDVKAITCGPHGNTGEVGNCLMSNCPKWRGPANCIAGFCHCKDGFCRYPEGIGGITIGRTKCYARIPGATCHVTRSCWSGGGFSKSFCNHGLCMCNNVGEWARPVKKADGSTTYVCTPGAGGMTEISDQDKAESHRLAMANVMAAGMWALAFVAAMVGLSIVVITKYKRNTRSIDLDNVLLG